MVSDFLERFWAGGLSKDRRGALRLKLFPRGCKHFLLKTEMAVSNATNLEVNKLLVSSSHRISGSNSSWRYEVKGDVLKCGPEAVFADRRIS